MNCKYLLISLAIFAGFPTFSPEAAAQSPQLVTLQSTNRFSGMTSMVEVYLAESVDVQPTFPGGDAAMMRFINAERRYPERAYAMSIQGRVVCGIVVEPDGSISNIDVIRGVEPSLNLEAVRIISAMPNWRAGEVNGAKVPVYCIVTIPFRR